jgi:hypothetical protein
MKLLLLSILFFSINTHASELEFEPFLYLINKSTVESYSSKPKTSKPKYKYKYKVLIHIKNISKQHVKIMTGNLSSTILHYETKEISIQNTHKTYKDSLIIPSETEINLVELRPNERTSFNLEFSSTKLILKSTIEYAISDLYNNRFKHWSGTIKSNSIDTYSMIEL